MAGSQQNGSYLGTEVKERWWHRYTKGGYLARGRGKYWCDMTGFYFLRQLTKKPITILFDDLIEVKTGRWHGGKWGQGKPVLKLLWIKDGVKLSSGFLITDDLKLFEEISEDLRKNINLDSNQ